MRSLSARDLLYVWEAGEDRRPLDRALMLLAALLPGRTREQLARLSIGRRDALLLNFRKATFGSRMDGVGRCPKCNGLLEFSVHVDDLLEKAPPGAEAPEPTLSMDGFHVRFRLPDSLDLAAVIHREDAAEAGDLLVRGCALEVRREGADASAETLPREVIEAMAARMAEQDPLAEIRLDLSCPDCGNGWPMLFDIVSFLWTEISSQAGRLLQEVGALARYYGWREADILSMSARRRRLYLEMAG